MIRGACEHCTERFAERIAEHDARKSRSSTGARDPCVGAGRSALAKLRGKFRYHILLHGPRAGPLGEVVREPVGEALKTPDEVQWIVDVDPVAML